jgi:hypothetical protein
MKKIRMKSFFLLTVWSIILFSCSTGVSDKEEATVWKMEEGLLVVEVESVKHGGPVEGIWQPVNDSLTGYTGETAYIMTSWGNMYKDPLVHDGPQTDSGYRLRYHVWIDEPGEYLLKVRNYHQLPDGDNDIWLSINEKMYQKAWDHDSLTWNWNEATANSSTYQPFELRKGINTIDIAGRSKGFAIDRFTIFKKGTPDDVWQNPENPESPLMKAEDEDNETPTAPTNLHVTDKGTGYLAIAWDASSDNHEVYAYDVFVNGERKDEVFQTSYVIDNLDAETHYNVHVKAKDFAGNLSEISEEIKEGTIPFNTSQDMMIEYLQKPPVIDGNEDELYAELPAHKLQFKSGEVNDSNDLNATFKTGWDSTYLFLLVNVYDDVLHMDAYDGVEILLDPDNSKSGTLSYNDRHYRFFLNRPKEEGKHHYLTAKINRDDFIKGVQEERQILSNQYVMEVALPWETLGTEPSANNLIGLNLVIRDYDSSSENMDGSLSLNSKSDTPNNIPIGFATAKLIYE